MKCSSAMVAARLTIGGFDARDRQPLFDLRLELRQVVAGIGRALVERVMLAAVDRLLRGEGLDLLGQLGRRAVAELRARFRRKRPRRSGRSSTGHCRLRSLRRARRAKDAERRFASEAAVARRDAQVGGRRQR